MIRIGCDVVEVKRIGEMDSGVLGKVFHESEMKGGKAESLAGIFAVKESCKKVFNDLDWLDIEVRKDNKGRPVVKLGKHEDEIESFDVSISHDGDYAMAVVAFEVGDDGKE